MKNIMRGLLWGVVLSCILGFLGVCYNGKKGTLRKKSELAVGCCDVRIGYVGGFLWLGLSLCVKGLR